MEDNNTRGTYESGVYFATHSTIKHTDEEFRLEIGSAGHYQYYALSAQHAKRLLTSLKKQVESFEGKFGEIRDTPKPIPSPTHSRPFGFVLPQTLQLTPERKEYRKVMAKKGPKKTR